ncbi:MAG: response regulator [Cyanobacteria bacterium J06623_7]
MTSSTVPLLDYQVDLKNSTILVVDDNSTNLSVIVDYLEEHDFTTLISKDGESSIRRAKYAKPDLILLDILMPGIDGYETCLRLKADPETKDVPIIFMTALSSIEDKVKGFEVGAIDYVTKPIHPQEVLARIQLHLRLRYMTSTLTQQNQRLQTEVKQRIEIEQQLKVFNEQLETKIEQRTWDLKQTNQSLRQEVQEREKAEILLRKSLQEKELLLKEIHHRVKNNLLVVASLLDWQTNYIEDRKIVKMFENSQDRIHSMALIHEQLYKCHDLKRLNIANYVADLVEKISYSHDVGSKGIEFLIDVEDVILNIETARPCGLIINELIGNALEHAFPPTIQTQGKIELHLKQETENKIFLSITDNGVGLADNFVPEESDSLGLQLVYTLTEQLDGELEIDRTAGTTFKITFSELQYNERL